MAFYITEDCACCGACADRCPAEAIYEGEDRFVIDPEKCRECGMCAEQCFAEAIVRK